MKMTRGARLKKYLCGYIRYGKTLAKLCFLYVYDSGILWIARGGHRGGGDFVLVTPTGPPKGGRGMEKNPIGTNMGKYPISYNLQSVVSVSLFLN